MGSCGRARVGRIAADRVRRILAFEHGGERGDIVARKRRRLYAERWRGLDEHTEPARQQQYHQPASWRRLL
jgi:hypothetical protein